MRTYAVRLVGVIVSMALLALGESAQAQSSDARRELPPAFPREGARQVLENDWGTVWDVTWTPGSATPMHRHAFDYVGVEFADTTFSVVAPNGQRRTLPAKAGGAWFLQRGTTHIEEMSGDSPARHAVVIDLKDEAAPSLINSSGSPTVFPQGVGEKIIDNGRVVMWNYTWPAEGAPTYFYDKNAFIVFVNGGELTSSVAGGPAQPLIVSTGQVLFRAGGRTLSERSAKGNVRGIVIELK
jgi:hypothetical protein